MQRRRTRAARKRLHNANKKKVVVPIILFFGFLLSLVLNDLSITHSSPPYLPRNSAPVVNPPVVNPPVVNPPVENPKPIKAAVSWKSLLTWKYVATGDSERKYAVADSCGGTPKELSEIPPEKKDRRTDAKYLRILNYNVQWLFLTKGVVKKHNNAKNFPWTSTALAMGHISRIAEIIDKLAPDIIHLTEVEDCHVIDVLISLLKEKETYLGYIVKASTVSNLALQNVAIITKLHPTRNLLRTDETLEAPWDGNSSCNPSWSNFGSNLPKHYLTQFEVPIFTKKTDLYPRSSLQLAFFGLHLTAFPYKENRCFEREGQAYLVTRLIAKTYNSPDSPKEIIITGDFNDLDPNVLQSIPRTGLSNTMNIIRGNVRLGGQLIHMENILNRIPQEKNYSSQFPGENYRDLLDHILLSPGMVARLESVEILNDLYSPEDNVSDHWPVLAIFKMFDDE